MSERTYIIAEAGVNHNGSVERAIRMVEVAKECGADCVKFQTFRADSLATENAVTAVYQRNNTGLDESQRTMLRRLELKRDDYAKLKAHCDRVGIEFMSSPFDVESARLLLEVGQRTFKIPSGEITNFPLLSFLAQQEIKIILSTGMSTLGDIEAALGILRSYGLPLERITVLHCNTEYPTPMVDVNLRAMKTIADAFGVSVGYSDHTDGIEVPIVAVALGGVLIEKHFTLDRNLPGPDHKASLVPEELANLVRCLRNVELALGSTVKKPSPSELKNRDVARKSIVAAQAIAEGEAFSESNLTTKRPGTGLSPMLWTSLLGRKAKRAFAADELIEV